MDLNVRPARVGDAAAVRASTRGTWADRDGVTDYVPGVFESWVETDGADQRTFVAEGGDEVAGLCQCVMLSEHEAWAQGMRVDPDYRGRGIAATLTEACFDWARGVSDSERAATVCRNMVFSWNTAGLGLSRAAGFDPATEFRWAHPEPDPDATAGTAAPDLAVSHDPDAAWTYWGRSDARDHLRGLSLDPGEPWALSECPRERFHRAAGERTVLAVGDGDGTRGATFRVRERTRERDGDTERWAVYGVAAWADLDAARALFAAIGRDAAGVDADRVRVLVPETVRHVSDAVRACGAVDDEPDFVLAADLTGR